MICLLMSRYTILFSIFFTIASCKGRTQKMPYNDGIIPASTYYKPSKLIDSLTKIFLDSSACKDCVNEINIDKVSFKETYITFRATPYKDQYESDYLSKQNPLFYFIKSEQKFFVITGVEEYIVGNQNNTKKLSFSDKDRTKVEMELIVQFKILKDSIYLQRVAGLPFMPEMNQDLPNDDSLPKFDPKKDYSQ